MSLSFGASSVVSFITYEVELSVGFNLYFLFLESCAM